MGQIVSLGSSPSCRLRLQGHGIFLAAGLPCNQLTSLSCPRLEKGSGIQLAGEVFEKKNLRGALNLPDSSGLWLSAHGSGPEHSVSYQTHPGSNHCAFAQGTELSTPVLLPHTPICCWSENTTPLLVANNNHILLSLGLLLLKYSPLLSLPFYPFPSVH